jgi:hypothetical protein
VNLFVDKGLLLVQLSIRHNNQKLDLPRVLIDTGSATTLFSAAKLLEIGLTYELEDTLSTVRGIGGSETVFGKTLQEIQVVNHVVANFKVQVGDMDYGFDLDGILGLDFLLQTRAMIDLDGLVLVFAR